MLPPRRAIRQVFKLAENPSTTTYRLLDDTYTVSGELGYQSLLLAYKDAQDSRLSR